MNKTGPAKPKKGGFGDRLTLADLKMRSNAEGHVESQQVWQTACIINALGNDMQNDIQTACIDY